MTATSSMTSPHAPQAMVDQSRAVLSKHARSFRWAAALLPSGRHDDAAVAYAFCRHVDDTADEAPSRDVATRGLEQITQQLDGDRPHGALIAAYLAMAKRNDIPAIAAEQLIEGARSDLLEVCVADDDELLRYCYRVAGTVGLMMCGVLGVRDQHAIAHAVDLGVAMQLTNICRDVLEDAQRGRVYLPATRLRAAGVEPNELLEGRASEAAVAAVVRDLLTLADRYYQSADDGMHFIPLRARFAIMAASRIYGAIGRRLVSKRNGNPLAGRMIVPPSSKIFWLVSSIVTTLVMIFQRHRKPHDHRLHTSLVGLLPDGTRAEGDK